MSEDYRSKDADDIQITKLCDVLGIDPIDIIRLECVHGVGHGLAKSLNYNVFFSLDEAKERITRLIDKEIYRSQSRLEAAKKEAAKFQAYKQIDLDSELPKDEYTSPFTGKKV